MNWINLPELRFRSLLDRRAQKYIACDIFAATAAWLVFRYQFNFQNDDIFFGPHIALDDRGFLFFGLTSILNDSTILK